MRRLHLPTICALVLLTACELRTDEKADAMNTPPTSASLPIADAPLTRADLLIAVMHAGSAAATRQDDSGVQQRLAGRPFELRLRFGCGNGTDQASGSMTFDPQARTVKISVPSEIGIESADLASIGGQDIEAAEGFWIRRPWLLDPACPPTVVKEIPHAPSPSATMPAPGSAAEAADLPRIGIVQIFTDVDARTHRREQRAYEANESLAVDQTPSRVGYELIIEGRLYAPSAGKVITCSPRADRAPNCMISARFDLVSIERADNGKLLAEWPSG